MNAKKIINTPQDTLLECEADGHSSKGVSGRSPIVSALDLHGPVRKGQNVREDNSPINSIAPVSTDLSRHNCYVGQIVLKTI